MASISSILVAAACAAPLSLVACGGSSNDDTDIVPEGAHHQYVVSQVSVPTSMAQVTQFGLDLGTKTSIKPDGVVENALGVLLATLSSPVVKFDIQGPITDAVTHGSLILLVDLQAKDLATADAAGFSVKFGTNPMPPACNGAGDTTCGKHLTGSAMFGISASSPADALVTGKVTGGTFSGGPGDLSLQIVLGSTTPIELSLLHARVQAGGLSDNGIMTATVGGLVTVAELTAKVGPAILTQVNGIVDRDCGPAPRSGATCGCASGSTGALVMGLADGMAMGSVTDCNITVEELLGNSLVKPLLAPDSCSKDSCAAADSLSIGVKVQAVKATF